VNTLHSFTLKSQNNQLELLKHYSIDIKTDIPKEHSASSYSNLNSSKEMSINSAASSMNYADWA